MNTRSRSSLRFLTGAAWMAALASLGCGADTDEPFALPPTVTD